MKAWPYIPGVPAAGHVTSSGFWHPGRIDGCPKCPSNDVHLRDENGTICGIRVDPSTRVVTADRARAVTCRACLAPKRRKRKAI